ncbi:MAG: hypothetical protein ACRC2U_19425 [Aeromonas sp.]
MTQQYIFDSALHTDFSAEYMTSIGLDSEQQRSVLAQREFEIEQAAVAAQIAATAERQRLIAAASEQIEMLTDAAAAHPDAQLESVADELMMWRQHRFELHMLPQQPGWPLDVSWPAAPSSITTFS